MFQLNSGRKPSEKAKGKRETGRESIWFIVLGKILIQFDPGLRAEGLMCNNFQFKAPSQDHGCKERRGEGRSALRSQAAD